MRFRFETVVISWEKDPRGMEPRNLRFAKNEKHDQNHPFGARKVRVFSEGISRSTTCTNLDRLKCAGFSVISISKSNDTPLILMGTSLVQGGPRNMARSNT